MRHASSEAERQQRAPRSAVGDRLAFQAAAANQVELEPFARHHPRLDARAVPANVTCASGCARQQLARDRDARIQVSARAAAGDHDSQRLDASWLAAHASRRCVLRHVQQNAHADAD